MPSYWIKRVGVFDYNDLYNSVKNWFEAKKYRFIEKNYKNKGNEINISMAPVKKVSEYVRFVIGLDMFILDIKNVDVVKDGKKTTMQQARAKIKLTYNVETDYQGRFDKSEKLQKLKKFIDNKLLKKKLDEEDWTNLWIETNDLKKVIETKIGMGLKNG
ncbi:hypothetical protein GOV04_01040 [Candidatus Woesearchaeota archaeon]|nr:hypothetical protein [Candidatus Woesearchaeota archaeon]